MDSNRRHQLAQNDLANWFITQYEDWIQPNLKWIGTAICGVLLLIVLISLSSRFVQWNKAAAWRQYYTALYSADSVGALEAISEASDGQVGVQSRLSLAQILLSEACNDVFTDQKAAQEKLDKATLHFQKVRDTAKDEQVQRQAIWGLGQAHEAYAAIRTDKNDLDAATKEYKMLSERWPDDYLGRRAVKQLAFIARPETKQFYELAAQKAQEKPKEEDFKVDIDTKDPFLGGPGSFDAQKALGGPSSSILSGEFGDAITEGEKKPEETKPEEKKDEEPKSADE